MTDISSKAQDIQASIKNGNGRETESLQTTFLRMLEIGVALSAEKDLEKLLEMIVDEARNYSHADAATLYIREGDFLHFKIMENESMDTYMGGTTGNPITLPPVPLVKENVSAYAAITGETVNIPDVYEAEEFDFTGPRKYDAATGYRSKSMLVVPMKNQENEIIGVLQLLNSVDPETKDVIAFPPENVRLVESLASQAAVAITNAKLIQDMENLFDSFVKVMATAIDERSPYTGGHIRRVAELGIMLCEEINSVKEGPLADVEFDREKLKEMTIAGWMHDLGKVTTPVHIMDKSTKLETIIDRVDMVKARMELIATVAEKDWLEKKTELLANGADREAIKKGQQELAEQLAQIDDDKDFLVRCNTGGEFMQDEMVQRVKDIGHRTFTMNGEERRYLTDDEIENLTIRKGTLLDSERQLMQDHVVVTQKMLEQIPFTKALADVPRIAGGHHECLDGSGYPEGLTRDQLPIGARIMHMVDFFEALTAADRPYKKPMPLEKALSILEMQVKDGKMDRELFDVFVNSGIPQKYTDLQRKIEEEDKVLDFTPVPEDGGKAQR